MTWKQKAQESDTTGDAISTVACKQNIVATADRFLRQLNKQTLSFIASFCQHTISNKNL